MECPICFKIYTTTQNYAVKLKCCHVVCIECIQRIKNENIVSCPVCFQKTGDVNLLSKCLTIEKIIEAMKKSMNEDSKELRDIDLVIRTLKGNLISLTISKNNTVLQLKERIKEIEGLDVRSQWLLFGGKALRDEESLEVSGLNDADIIYLVIRSFGG